MTKIMVYVMTHRGDPKHECWGGGDCMGPKRLWRYEAVIGVGSIKRMEPGYAGKVIWVGIKPPLPSKRGPLVKFEFFYDFEMSGPDIHDYPPLAAKIRRAPRGFMSMKRAEQEDAERILEKAKCEKAKRKLLSTVRRQNGLPKAIGASCKRPAGRSC